MLALMFAQTDNTGRTVTMIVFALVAVAAALALLTAWYWRITDPSRREQGSNGRGGKRRTVQPEPEPEPEAGPSAGLHPDRTTEVDKRSTTGTPTTAAIDFPPDEGAGVDPTRVLRRSDILDGAAPDQRVIDLRTPPDVDTPAATPAAESLGVQTPSAASDEPMIDLTEPHPVDDVEPERVEVSAASGAHDAGMSFEDWLALSEEDQ